MGRVDLANSSLGRVSLGRVSLGRVSLGRVSLLAIVAVIGVAFVVVLTAVEEVEAVAVTGGCPSDARWYSWSRGSNVGGRQPRTS